MLYIVFRLILTSSSGFDVCFIKKKHVFPAGYVYCITRLLLIRFRKYIRMIKLKRVTAIWLLSRGNGLCNWEHFSKCKIAVGTAGKHVDTRVKEDCFIVQFHI